MKEEINNTLNAIPLPWLTKMLITGMVASFLAFYSHWAVSVEERISANSLQYSAQKEQIKAQEDKVNRIMESLARIEDKIDKINDRAILRGGK